MKKRRRRTTEDDPAVCECNSPCRKFPLSYGEYAELVQDHEARGDDIYIIAAGCEPWNADDKLLLKTERYSAYRDPTG